MQITINRRNIKIAKTAKLEELEQKLENLKQK